MKVFYGTQEHKINITQTVLDYCVYNNIIYIPSFNRSSLFGDPVPGVKKYIFIYEGEAYIQYHDTLQVLYNIDTKVDIQNHIIAPNHATTLQKIQDKLIVNHGNKKWEIEEQIMSVMFIKGHEKVLELGANIGRNTLVIASLLKDPMNLVALECDPVSVAKLQDNKDQNNLPFHIEPSALSKRKLIQKAWDTIPSEEVLEGYFPVSTITYDELMAKYKIPFDTIVADCEGALYYILMDMPEVLNNIKMIMMENDYHELQHKNFVDSLLISKGFERVYNKKGGWGPCEDRFWEVWRLS